jgi:hypothetical protein
MEGRAFLFLEDVVPVGFNLSDEQLRVAMTSPAALKRYLSAADKTYLVLRTDHLVDALPWPEGIDAVQQVVSAYRDHRAVIPSGWVEVMPGGAVGPITLAETLSLDEVEEAIRQLQRHRSALQEDMQRRRGRRGGDE